MKFTRLITLALCAATVMTACTQENLPTGTPNQIINPDGSITPSPKGPKPFDGVGSIDNIALETSPALDSSAGKNLSERISDGDAALAPPTSPMAGGATGTNDANFAIPEGEAIAAPEEAPQPEPAATTAPSASPTPNPEASAEALPPEQSQNFFYFSYDDSASTAGVGQTKYALQNGLNVNPNWVRPWEFLSFENFTPQNPVSTGTFEVAMGLWQHSVPGNEGLTDYDLGIHVKGPEITTSERRKLVLTVVVDTSGSMNDATSLSVDDSQGSKSLMEIARVGLKQLSRQLKNGDMVNLVSFNRETRILLESYVYNGDTSELNLAIDQLVAEGGTNLDAGLKTAYEVANRHFDNNAINRVIMLTDAFANQGSVDPTVISQATRVNDSEGIYFSGLGFGFGFNEAFLNTLTEAGKGTYFSVNTEADARRAFDERFMSLVNIAARDVRFRLDYPASLKRTVSNAEQSSQNAEDVDPIHFSYNTDQFFLERFRSDGEGGVSSGKFKLTIDYTDPISNEKRSEVRELDLSELLNKELPSIKDARVITLLTDAITGKLSPSQARAELEQLLQTHSSPLANEYKGYLETFLSMQPNDPVSVEPRPTEG